MPKKLEVPTDPPQVSISKPSSWVNVIQKFLFNILQSVDATFLCAEAFPPLDAATAALWAQQETLALRVDEITRANHTQLLSALVGNASRRLSGEPVALDDEDAAAAAAATAAAAADVAILSAAIKNANCYGEQVLQDYMLQLLIKMTSKNHSTLLNDIIPGTFNCGRNALRIIENFIMPKNAHTLEMMTRAYDKLKDSFNVGNNIYDAFEKLLEAYYVKMHIARALDPDTTTSPKPCMNDFLAVLLRAFGPDSAIATQWENRTARLQMHAIATNTPAMTDNETVRDFQVWLNEFQQKRASTKKALKSDIGKEKKGNNKNF